MDNRHFQQNGNLPGDLPVEKIRRLVDEPELTGGKVNYYLAYVPYPRRDEQPVYQAECEDIIAALKMTFDEACIFKAIWRSAAARLGNKKPGHKAVYDAEKMVHYSGHVLNTAKRAVRADHE